MLRGSLLIGLEMTLIACQAHGARPRVHQFSLSAAVHDVQGYGGVAAGMAQLSVGFQAPPGIEQPEPRRTPTVRVTSLPADLVRRAVAASYRAAGVGASDSQIDSVITRSRVAALLPEVRLRGAQYAGLDSVLYDPTSGSGRGTNRDQYRDTRTLEARVTWHLDRLVYGGDEPQLERLRTDRLEIRLRLASKVIESLLRRHRALIDLGRWPSDSSEADEAALHLAEAEATLDMLTGGAFTRGFVCEGPCD